MTGYAISLAGLSKTYSKGWQRKRVEAVRDVSLDISDGEAFGFIGPNGAGKSTTIKMLMGLAMPTAGSIFIYGVPTSRPESRKGLGYVPESPYLYDYLTPIEILTMGLRLHDVSVANSQRHCGEWLERFGLSTVASSPIRTFSKGMTQRVAIAQALCINPRLLVMDEPLSGLDPVGRQEVVDILAGYKRQGGTLFFTSHVLHDVERLADRFGLIHQGELRSVGSPAELAGAEDSVLLRSQGEYAVHGMAPETEGRWSGVFARADLWAQLRLIEQAGHVIVEIRPTLSLESAFMKAIGR